MSKKKKLTSGILLGLGFGVLLFLLYDFGLNNIVTNIKRISWWFIPIISIYVLVYLQNAWVWYIILDDKEKKIPFYKIFAVTLSGMSINDITPVVNLGGEPYKIYAVKDQIGTHQAVSSVILYTMVHWLSHFFVWITGIILISFTADLSDVVRYFLFASFIAIFLLILFFYRRHRKGIFVSFLDKISKVPFLKGLAAKLSEKEETFVEIDEQIKNLYHNRPGAFYFSIFLDYLGRIISSLEFYFIMMAIHSEISFLEAFYIYAGYTLLVNIMFFMPLQLGTREGSLVLVMEALKIATGMGVFVSLIMRIREFFWIGLGLALIQINRIRKKSHKKVSDFLKFESDDK